MNFNNPFTVAFYDELRKNLLYYNPPPHLNSVAALPCEIWMFNCTTSHDSSPIQKCVKSFIYSKYLQKCHILYQLYVPSNLQLLQRVFKISAISTQACFALCMPVCQWMRQWRVLAMPVPGCAKRVTGAVAMCCVDMMSDDFVGTQKRQLSSNKSIKQKYLVVYHFKMKLSIDVSIILAKINE